MDTLLEILVVIDVIINLLLSLIIIIWDIYFYFKMDEKEKWTKILYAIVGLCWFIRYLLFLFGVENYNAENVNALLVLLLTFTLLALAVGSIIRVNRLVGLNGLRDDLLRLPLHILKFISKR